jgi:hypothetical protein
MLLDTYEAEIEKLVTEFAIAARAIRVAEGRK